MALHPTSSLESTGVYHKHVVTAALSHSLTLPPLLLPHLRLSVLSAITSTQQRLKRYPRVPENGLVLYCGTIVTDEGKEKKVSIDFEPFKPINTSLYLCDNKFHTEVTN